MKFLAAATTIVIIGTLASRSRATVSIGDNGNGENIAWIEGENPCTGHLANINSKGDNPCGIKFTLDNGQSYQLTGCGTTGFSLLNGDGSFNHACESATSNIKCSNLGSTFHRSYEC